MRRTASQRFASHASLWLIALMFTAPFVWMVSTSLKSIGQAMADPPVLVPDPVMVENYSKVIRHDRLDFPLYARNTLIIAALAVTGTVLSSSLVAYGFARIRFKGRTFFFVIMLATMMIPFPVVMVPIYSLFKWFGDHTGIEMLGTARPLWIRAWFGSAFNIFLLRQFFLTVPEDLSEAARIDGCSEFGIYWRIMLPLAKPALAVVALFTFMAAWNDFLGPLIYLQRPEQWTLSLGLQGFQSQLGGAEWPLMMAASVLVILPIIVLFFLTQRTFIQGIATTGMKA
jgi:multiple sugar transport system permease protein